jgi:hypothetical protein
MIPRLLSVHALLCLSGLAQMEIDAVAEGRKAFENFGCMVCHGVAKDDPGTHTGPSLFGLFLNEPRLREVADPQSGERRNLTADRSYFLDCVRKSWDALAVAEHGPTAGEPFPPAMPSYSREVIPDAEVDYIWHYLRTLAEPGDAGPAIVKLNLDQQATPKNILEIPDEVVVSTRPRVFRAPLRGSSGRALHVGLPNGINCTFDPRVLSVRNVWGGGFLNLRQERSGRGQPGSERGIGNSVFIQGSGILQPLDRHGELIDFEFKEPDVLDDKTVERWLWDDRDFLDLLAGIDAEYLGHRLDAATHEPVFQFRIGKNRFSQKIRFSENGRLEITLEGPLEEPQQFRVTDEGLDNVQTSGGTLENGIWSLDPASAEHHISARLKGGLIARPLPARMESWESQPLVTNSNRKGNHKPELPPGYRLEHWESPKDLYGLDQLFEATGIAVAKDGTIVITTRTAGIWRIRDQKWSLFAEGTFEVLGVVIEDDRGDQIVVMQKPEMTRISDSDGDGRADVFLTLCDDYGFHGNYHEYAHGPVLDAAGNYYFTLNLTHGGDDRTSWRAGGPFMGSMGGYRGWACRLTPEGKFEPFANGLRSPAGLGIDPHGRLWYAENQGEYVGSSKVVPLEQGKFYGHLSGLVDLPGGMKPDSPELHFRHWKDQIRKGAVWLPHGKLANSPGHPAWDLTEGKFGPFGNQMFIGDQTLSTLLRVSTQQVKGADQGVVVPFARGLASGVMRPCFLPDGSLLLGQTGRGWSAHGGLEDSLQRIIYDGTTIPADIHDVVSATDGFLIRFNSPLAAEISEQELKDQLKIRSWFYTNDVNYGSPEHDRRDDTITQVTLSPDRKSALVVINDFGKDDRWLDRIYHIELSAADRLFNLAPSWNRLEAYFTLRAIPD